MAELTVHMIPSCSAKRNTEPPLFPAIRPSFGLQSPLQKKTKKTVRASFTSGGGGGGEPLGFLLMGLNCNGLKPNKTSAQMIFFPPHLTALPPRDVCTVEHIWKDSTCMSPLGFRGTPPDKCSCKMLDVLFVVSYSVEMFVLNLTLGVTNSLFTSPPWQRLTPVFV